MKKLSLLLTILIVPLVFGGCNADESKMLTGSWKYGYNISALLTEADETAYFDLEEHKADVIITFYADGTYTFGFDEALLKTAVAEIKSELVAESEDYIRKIVADQGAIYQLFADSVVQEMREETEEEIAAMVEEIYSELSATKQGTFLVKDGKIYWDDIADEYDLYTIKENTLTIDKPESSEKDELYPIVLAKVE